MGSFIGEGEHTTFSNIYEVYIKFRCYVIAYFLSIDRFAFLELKTAQN